MSGGILLIWTFLPFLCICVGQVTTVDYPSTCKESEKTMKKVDSCPKNEKDWENQAKVKGCDLIQQNCSSNEEFQYHCLLHGSGTYLVDVCAPVSWIVGKRCGEYNDFANIIQSRHEAPCKKFDVPCPYRFISNASFRYQQCYDLVEKSTSQQTEINQHGASQNNAFTEEDNASNRKEYVIAVVAGVFGGIVLIAVIVCMTPVVRKKRGIYCSHKDKDGQTDLSYSPVQKKDVYTKEL